MKKSVTQQIGALAEQCAETYLRHQGLKFISRNYRCKLGEIDLIMRDQNCVVFVEVRSRNNANYGTSAETINIFKQKKLIKAATFYLISHKLWEKTSSRFDVVSIDNKNEIDWIKNAFQVEY
jgi:putative endonuclease